MSSLDSLKQVLKEKINSWRQAIKRYWKRIIIAVLIIAAILITHQMFPDKGFGEVNKPPSDYYRPAKTLWDLLSLLVVPLGLGLVGLIVGYLLNSHQKEREEKSQTNRFQEETLQKYLDVMTQLMLKEGLRNDNATLSPHVRQIARYRTLTVLRELDGERKATLLRFLYESHLIEKDQNLVSLDDADFSEGNLCGVKLQDAHLEKVNLSEANLSKADLRGAYLFEANLTGTNLRRAKLAHADFGGAILKEADLTDAEEYTHDQLLKASLWENIKPADLENSLGRQRVKSVLPPDLKDWLNKTDWIKMTDHISHETTLEYNDDENETHGRWVVTRGRHKIGPLKKGFSLGIYLVTNELFFQFVHDKGYYAADDFWEGTPPQSKEKFRCQDGKTYGPSTWPSEAGFLEERARHPVAGISYYEALAFCRWLYKVYPPENGWKWCLPTENMWELVARPEKDFLYPWGPKFEPDHSNSVEAKIGTTTEVDRFQEGKSKNGCFDMAGNVWEFVREDREEHWYCVLRGGSYRNYEPEVKSSLRLWGVPRDHRPPDFGFRCALVCDSA